MNISKMSFHPSGKVHVDFDKGLFRPNFWRVEDRTFLLLMMFRDIHKLSRVTRKRDFARPSLRIMAKDFGFREDDSLQCAIMLRPVIDNELKPIEDARYVQWAKIYNNFTDARKRPMILHFILAGKDADGKSHLHTTFIYPHINLNPSE